jgi:hypothetical protein
MKRTAKKPMSSSQHRVIWVTDALRNSFRKERDSADLTNEKAIEKLVSTRLPKLVASLQKLGLTKQGSKHRPLRLPIDDTSLAALSKASQQTEVPLVTLLRLIIS